MAIKMGARSRLPRGCIARFVGEGAANVVFELTFPDPSSQNTQEFRGYLLRVPKAGKNTYTYPELQSYWEHDIVPIFGRDWLVEQRLVDLTVSDIIPHLNKVLTAEDERKPKPKRRVDFIGGRVDNVKYGMLVEDMRKKSPTDFVIEFKPKWLTQSPSAPADAKRCRTCAREALRQHKDNKGGMRRTFCPLDLLRSEYDPKAQEALCAALVPELDPFSTQFHLFSEWLRTNQLLKTLARVQQESDRHGTLRKENHDPNFELAMALRDCSCFIRIPGAAECANGNGVAARRVVEAKLGDVDKKNWEKKLGYWRELEEDLCQGYYRGTEKPRQRTKCQLERS
ncbi:inositol-pentakisphosphate 2-kinase [Zalerion maritima]|uniref:Inositol-pentakisphosphate 2-kinase n=1 Tax=Zalerion maritima TaxID=339359 RepID=A0AAD5WQW9_9PEZI|nr:inositol-pentakisphosphate 2-kinase [Zalerion maritima]